MTLLTVAEFRAFETSTLDDAPLQVLLDASEFEITRFAGPLGVGLEWFGGGQHFISLRRAAASITSIVESTVWDGVPVTLATDDYLLYPGGYSIQRVGTGTNQRWSWWGRIAITYVPVDDLALRKAVQVDLMKMALAASPGLVGSERIGDWEEHFQQTLDANQEERGGILSRLRDGPSLVVVGG